MAQMIESAKIGTDFDVDIIGEVFQDTGNVDAEGNPIMVQIEGFFANIRRKDGGDITDQQRSVLSIVDWPSNPVRMWADAPTPTDTTSADIDDLITSYLEGNL